MTGSCSDGRLSRRFPRLGDPHYRRFIRWDLEARLLLGHHLRRVADYHHGEPADFTGLRDRYLSRIVRFARENSEYYGANLPNVGRGGLSRTSETWKSIPLLDKATIRQNLSSLVTTPLNCPWVGTLTTGGSTGEPFGFPYMGGHDAEHQEFLWRLHGYQNGDRILAMDGTLVSHTDVAVGKYWTQKSDHELPYGGMALSGHYLSSDTKDDYLNFLLDYRPEFIRGYPSLVSEIALLARRRNVYLGCKGVELSSESHTDRQVELIESALGPVFDQYGHAEASIFGYSLEARGVIFCSPLYGLVEVLDEAGGHVAPGGLGEVVVTGFHNYAMPFIRYRTGDLAVLEGDVDGIVRLRTVIGRTQDYLLSEDGEKHMLTALIFGRHYSAFSRIDGWQLVQETPGEVIVRVSRGTGYSLDDEEEIRRNFLELARIKTSFDYQSGIDRSARAKSPLVIQRVLSPGAS